MLSYHCYFLFFCVACIYFIRLYRALPHFTFGLVHCPNPSPFNLIGLLPHPLLAWQGTDLMHNHVLADVGRSCVDAVGCRSSGFPSSDQSEDSDYDSIWITYTNRMGSISRKSCCSFKHHNKSCIFFMLMSRSVYLFTKMSIYFCYTQKKRGLFIACVLRSTGWSL